MEMKCHVETWDSATGSIHKIRVDQAFQRELQHHDRPSCMGNAILASGDPRTRWNLLGDAPDGVETHNPAHGVGKSRRSWMHMGFRHRMKQAPLFS